MRKPISEHFLQVVNLEDETLPSQPLVEICGCRRVLIENHAGIIEYGTERIGVRVKYGTVEVSGSELRLCRMIQRQLVISGSIDSVVLHKGGNR